MKLEGDSGFPQLERSGVGAPEDPPDYDLLLNVIVKVSSYSAADQCWIAAGDVERFLLELRKLESRRQGQAVVFGASPDDLRLEFYSTDSLGHMAVKGYVGWQKSEEFPCLVSHLSQIGCSGCLSTLKRSHGNRDYLFGSSPPKRLQRTRIRAAVIECRSEG